MKGIGIFEVMLHHSMSNSARHYTAGRGSMGWWLLSLGNRVLHFAVPVFLLASALLLARSLAKHDSPNWRRFYLRRAERSLVPFLIWTFIFIGVRLFILQEPKDMVTVTTEFPWGSSVTGPALLVDPSVWIANLVWGKGAFHLYFLSVLLQMSIAFPLFFYLFKWLRVGFGPVLFGSLALQAGAFWLQEHVIRFGAPWSMILSYLPPVLIGTWIGLNWSQWPEVWRRWRWFLIVATVAAFAWYLQISVAELRREEVPPLMHRSAFAYYAVGMALVLLPVAQWLAMVRLGKFFSFLGNISLALFLVHPIFLYGLGSPAPVRIIKALPASPLVSFLGMFFLSLGFTYLCIWLRVDRWLFGRRFKEPPPPKPPEPPLVPEPPMPVMLR